MTSKKYLTAFKKQRICYWICRSESIIVTVSPEIHWKIKMTEIVSIGFGNIGQFYQISVYSFSCFSFLHGLDGGDKT